MYVIDDGFFKVLEIVLYCLFFFLVAIMRVMIAGIILVCFWNVIRNDGDEVQWDALENLMRMYVCKGNTDWLQKSKIEKLYVAMSSILIDFMCPREKDQNNTVRIVDLISDVKTRLKNYKNTVNPVEQSCLDHRIKIFLAKISCCPEIRVTLQDQFKKLYQSFSCTKQPAPGSCRILLYLQQDQLFKEFYHLTNVTSICTFCPGTYIPSHENGIKVKRKIRKRQYDPSSVFFFTRYMVELNDKHGISIDLDQPALYLRHMLFLTNDLLICFTEYLYQPWYLAKNDWDLKSNFENVA